MVGGFSANGRAGRGPSCPPRAQLAETLAKPTPEHNKNVGFILLYTSFSAIIQVFDKSIPREARRGRLRQHQPRAAAP
jgi:hypothetical protein